MLTTRKRTRRKRKARISVFFLFSVTVWVIASRNKGQKPKNNSRFFSLSHIVVQILQCGFMAAAFAFGQIPQVVDEDAQIIEREFFTFVETFVLVFCSVFWFLLHSSPSPPSPYSFGHSVFLCFVASIPLADWFRLLSLASACFPLFHALFLLRRFSREEPGADEVAHPPQFPYVEAVQAAVRDSLSSIYIRFQDLREKNPVLAGRISEEYYRFVLIVFDCVRVFHSFLLVVVYDSLLSLIHFLLLFFVVMVLVLSLP